MNYINFNNILLYNLLIFTSDIYLIFSDVEKMYIFKAKHFKNITT